MVDFKKAREAAFEFVERTNSIEKINVVVPDRRKGLKRTIEIFRVTIELLRGGVLTDVVLEIELKQDFPLSLPKIKISQNDYEAIKYIPHIDCSRDICYIDSDNLKLDVENPGGILKYCINRAKKIIGDGINGDKLSDFQEEIVAYWENTYSPKDTVVGGFAGVEMKNIIPGNTFPAYFLNQPYRDTNIYVCGNSDDSDKLLDYFRFRGHVISRMEGLFLGHVDEMEPPFFYTNKSLLEFLTMEFESKKNNLKAYLNKNSFDKKLMMFSSGKKDNPIFFGFFLYPFKTNIKGWRLNKLNALDIMLRVYPKEPVIRVRFVDFTPERITKRTDGRNIKNTPYKFVMSGLGSIGSNLLQYLNNLNVSDFFLIDPEILEVENINRHLLSYNDVGEKKVDGLYKYLIHNNPFLNIDTFGGSVVDAMNLHLKKINEMDFIFCAIGKDPIENYILQGLTEGIIKVPIFIFWVEPYLIGAHVLYLRPFSSLNLKEMDRDGFYRFNVIDKSDYLDPEKQLSLKEAGCQGTYLPYGQKEITLFFSLLMPRLYEMIANPPTENRAITYTGDFDDLKELQLTISDFGQSIGPNKITIKEI
ncbi:E2/UBC family protein [Sphingobacterium prati]|uniref:E2/UBC family protein n=1 Tax=Sphingobacterium prati TaxID=2737006 RepID=UPI0015550574|nr:E2/UBC family protein [Sphingobacterium prati]NPE46325.1 hypothetical protein [Sphingobacterium prati]